MKLPSIINNNEGKNVDELTKDLPQDFGEMSLRKRSVAKKDFKQEKQVKKTYAEQSNPQKLEDDIASERFFDMLKMGALMFIMAVILFMLSK
jgi:hypothetical protein